MRKCVVFVWLASVLFALALPGCAKKKDKYIPPPPEPYVDSIAWVYYLKVDDSESGNGSAALGRNPAPVLIEPAVWEYVIVAFTIKDDKVGVVNWNLDWRAGTDPAYQGTLEIIQASPPIFKYTPVDTIPYSPYMVIVDLTLTDSDGNQATVQFNMEVWN